MTGQLQLDVGTRRAAPIEARLLRELDHLLEHLPPPDDDENVRAHRALIAGHELLLDWLATVDPLPEDALEWPCSACRAAPGEPCDVPGARTKWTPPGPRYHLDRGLHGRWGDAVGRGADPDTPRQQEADDRDLDAELRRRIDQRAPGWQAAPHGLLLLSRRRAKRTEQEPPTT